MAAAAGIRLLWEDFEHLSKLVPLIARIYPNGQADVNDFHQAGGMGFILQELMEDGLLDITARTSWGKDLSDACQIPVLNGAVMNWSSIKVESLDENILRPTFRPFKETGGIKVLSGNLGKAVIKISSVSKEHFKIAAKAMVFSSQAGVKLAFDNGMLEKDVIVVVRGQGPRANGMPELHSLTPMLSVIQEKGFKVALVTDGRMSGASGKIPAAIHLYPEAIESGPISKINDGDLIVLDVENGLLRIDVDLSDRTSNLVGLDTNEIGFGNELFSVLRNNSANAEMGGGVNNLS
jgi:phosphogluconate dehydratase